MESPAGRPVKYSIDWVPGPRSTSYTCQKDLSGRTIFVPRQFIYRCTWSIKPSTSIASGMLNCDYGEQVGGTRTPCQFHLCRSYQLRLIPAKHITMLYWIVKHLYCTALRKRWQAVDCIGPANHVGPRAPWCIPAIHGIVGAPLQQFGGDMEFGVNNRYYIARQHAAALDGISLTRTSPRERLHITVLASVPCSAITYHRVLPCLRKAAQFILSFISSLCDQEAVMCAGRVLIGEDSGELALWSADDHGLNTT